MKLIKSAEIIDGTGKPSFRGDILIKDDRIAAIGNFSHKKFDTVINGLGLVVAPGFIDVNANSDHYLSLFNNPAQSDFTLQGVTTIIGGQCGSSLAPLLRGTLKSIRRWGNENLVNLDWATVAEFKSTLRKLGIGVNFGMLAGHFTIRRDLAGEGIRDLSDGEFDIFNAVLEKAFSDGALGLSSGLGYVLSRWVSHSEIKRILSVVAASGKVYATHLRNEKDDIIPSVEETLKIAEETGIPTIISHLRPIIGFEGQFLQAFTLIEEKLNKGNIYFDVNPFSESVIPVYSLLPVWAQHGNFEVMLGTVGDSKYRQRILDDLAELKEKLSEMTIIGAKDNEYILGKTLQEFSEDRGIDIYSGLLNLMEITSMRSLLLHKNINQEILSDILFHPRALIGSNGASLLDSPRFLKPEKSTATFKKYIKLSLSRNMTLPEIIRKITSVPAKLFNINKRGILREGWFADIAMFRNGKIENVMINGKFAVQNGEETNILAGTPL
ncbi:MAG: amidohydrolase family protein [Patescibacteria group bacterium]